MITREKQVGASLWLTALLAAVLLTAAVWIGTDRVSADTREGLCVNEVCADEDENGSVHMLNSATNEYYDWIELYNCSDEVISTEGYYLTDKQSSLDKSRLAAVDVPAHGFVIVYTAKTHPDPEEGQLLADFGVSKKGGDTIYLTDGSNIIDSLVVDATETDKTWSRYPDGGDRVTLTDATPLAANTFTVAAPVLSQTSGFYDEPFELEMTGEDDVTIYYTTDGSTPTTSSKQYTGPISIKNASTNKNVYSARKDVSTLLQTSLLKKYGGMQWHAKSPSSKVDKGTRIKAIAVDSQGNQSKVAYSIYFVGLNDDFEYQNIPVISIQASDSSLFGYEKGIYVLGKKFAYQKKHLRYGWQPQYWNANYKGDREITGTVTYFQNIDSEPVTEKAKLSLKGNFSRSYPQKSWSIKGDTIYCNLETGGIDAVRKLKDPTGYLICQDLNVESANMQVCEVFLNGEYWGVYYISDKLFSKKHYAEKYNVDKSSISIIKEGKLNEGHKSDKQDYNKLMSYVKNHNMRKASSYKYVTNRVDIDSMIDYYLAEMFFSNNDWRQGWNYAMWRSSQLDNKWRFIVFDLNHSTCFSDTSTNMLKRTISRDSFFRNVYKNATFRKKFRARYNELLKTSFSKTSTTEALNTVFHNVRPYIAANMTRFYSGQYTAGSCTAERNRMKKFFSKKGNILKRQIN